MSKIEHEWAIISCGVPAKIIAVEAKNLFHKVYLDIGHCIDNAINPDFTTYYLTTLD
jgi:hypothetical protein